MLRNYEDEVKSLQRLGKDWNLTDEQINLIMEDSFRLLGSEESDRAQRADGRRCPSRAFGLIASGLAAFLLLCLLVAYNRPATAFVERNVHQLVFPAMKLLRKLALPLVRTFPSLTEWYDEGCLISNPYFQVPDLDCWPCGNVRSVLNLTTSDVNNEKFHSGFPFVVKEPGLQKVGLFELGRLYRANRETFRRDAPRALSELGGVLSVEELFSQISSRPAKEGNRFIWKLNRLEPTRKVRSIFGILSKLPSYVSGATPEKFLIIDDQATGFRELPVTEGSIVYVIQGSGSRLYSLDPSAECQPFCQRVSIVLQPHHVLWYSWWYWRASSAPLRLLDEPSVSLVGSYF